jgi:Fe-S-cluster-containing hydrogenase component 2
MRAIKPQSDNSSSISHAIAEIVISGPLIKSSFLTSSGNQVDAFCLRCPDKNCLTSESQTVLAAELCPAGAISLDKNSKNISISSACFGCGLCAVVCPTGAITISETGKAEVGLNLLPIATEETDKSQWEKWINGKLEIKFLTSKEISSTAEYLANRCMELKGTQFYKTVESILRLLDYEAKMSNLGDTINRIDLIIRTTEGNVPVEIKSYTETPTINLKSVQQAVENKLLISRLDGVEKMTSLSSLVIGFSYPNERSRIEEHILEIEKAYGIRVGIASLSRLWELLLIKKFSKEKVPPIDLVGIRGVL